MLLAGKAALVISSVTLATAAQAGLAISAPVEAENAAATGRTLIMEWGGGSAVRGGKLENVQDPVRPGQQSLVATFNPQNRQGRLELICTQSPQRQVMLRFTPRVAVFEEWNMHTASDIFYNEVEVKVDRRSRDDLADTRLWTYTATDASLTDASQVTAFARVLASEAQFEITFVRNYSGPSVQTVDGIFPTGTRFPQKSMLARLSGGGEAVRAVFEACGYSTSGL